MPEPMTITFLYICAFVSRFYLNLLLPCICNSGELTMQTNSKLINQWYIQAAQAEGMNIYIYNIYMHNTSSSFGSCTHFSLVIPVQSGELYHDMFMLFYANDFQPTWKDNGHNVYY